LAGVIWSLASAGCRARWMTDVMLVGWCLSAAQLPSGGIRELDGSWVVVGDEPPRREDTGRARLSFVCGNELYLGATRKESGWMVM
jgi:hypothetical protein